MDADDDHNRRVRQLLAMLVARQEHMHSSLKSIDTAVWVIAVVAAVWALGWVVRGFLG